MMTVFLANSLKVGDLQVKLVKEYERFGDVFGDVENVV